MSHTILVVEDDMDLRELMQQILEMGGYKVVTAEDGVEALALLGTIERLCLVVLDLIMPRMDGWQFSKHLRARADLGGVPILVHSSSTAAPPPEATRVLQKPVELKDLMSIVEQYCARS